MERMERPKFSSLVPESSPEAAPEVETMGTEMNVYTRLVTMVSDPQIREGAKALLRTVANAAISAVDAVPGIGEVASWAADIGKFFEGTDLTPDVGKGIAISTEGLEFITGGAMPSHLMETVLQFRHDRQRLVAALEKCKTIWQMEKTEYEGRKADIDEAIGIFS